MATITPDPGDNTTIVTGEGNVYDVMDSVVTLSAFQPSARLDTTINLEGGAALVVEPQLFGLDLDDSVRFSGQGDIIAFEDPANISSGLFGKGPLNLADTGFGSTDGIAVVGTGSISAERYNPDTGLLVLTINGTEREIILGKGLDRTDFQIVTEAGLTVVVYVACFTRGTLIATPSSEVAVEALAPGDEVRLARGGVATVAWIGRRRLRPGTSSCPQALQPIEFAAGALGENVPLRPLRVSPEHALHLDGHLVPAGLLVNGTSIRRLEVESVDYFHVELDRHEIILADGAPAESYLDTGNRAMFANAPLARIDAATAPIEPHRPGTGGLCAPMLMGGPALEAIRARLDERAGSIARADDRAA